MTFDPQCAGVLTEADDGGVRCSRGEFCLTGNLLNTYMATRDEGVGARVRRSHPRR